MAIQNVGDGGALSALRGNLSVGDGAPTKAATPESFDKQNVISETRNSVTTNGGGHAATLAKAAENLKQQFANSPYVVEFDTDANAQRGWLNVVDKETGKVVYEFPPEQVRKLAENGSVKGLSINSTR